MNRVGILTFHRANNIGAVLQASAICHFLRLDNIDAELIDYVPNTACTIPQNTIYLQQYTSQP